MFQESIFMIGFWTMRLFFFCVCVMWTSTVFASGTTAQECPVDGSDPACFFVNDQSHPIQTVTPTSTTSDCVGDTSRPECVVDTWVTCLVQDQDPELCERIKWDQQWVYFINMLVPSQPSVIGILSKNRHFSKDNDGHISLSYQISYLGSWGAMISFQGFLLSSTQIFMEKVGNGWRIRDSRDVIGVPGTLRAITHGAATSDCIGDLSIPVCAVDTVHACYVEQTDEDTCQRVLGTGFTLSEDEKSDALYRMDYLTYSVKQQEDDSQFISFREDGKLFFADIEVEIYHAPFYGFDTYTHFLWHTPRGWVLLEASLIQEISPFCEFPEYCKKRAPWD